MPHRLELLRLEGLIQDLCSQRTKTLHYIYIHKALISPARRLPADIVQEIFLRMAGSRSLDTGALGILASPLEFIFQKNLKTPAIQWLERVGGHPLSLSTMEPPNLKLWEHTAPNNDVEAVVGGLIHRADRWHAVELSVNSASALRLFGAVKAAALRTITLKSSIYDLGKINLLTTPSLRAVTIALESDFDPCNLPGRGPPAFSAPSHRDHHRDSRPRYRDDRDDVPTPGALSLRRAFARPPYTDIARDALLAAAPELSGVPAEFIRHCLRPRCSTASQPSRPRISPTFLPRSHLPAALTVPLRASPGSNPVSYPTHALAITPASEGKGGGEHDAAHAIFPVHALVLAAHCADLPRLPPCTPADSSRTASATLHVLPLTLPSPHAFAILHALMYTHRLPPALAALLPLPPAFLPSASSHGRSGEELTHATLLATLASPPALHTLASHALASSTNPSALMRHAGHVKELWPDLMALACTTPSCGIVDLAWEVVLGALNLAAQ
ncbi:hypothetical protein DFH09DRAFT_1459403 [Mycena vulgaris]|nr:hypothetical protein DFH09DRAFT_1459403 [Mycena vulgaris]